MENSFMPKAAFALKYQYPYKHKRYDYSKKNYGLLDKPLLKLVIRESVDILLVANEHVTDILLNHNHF